MKIRKMSIRNYRNLREVVLEDLDDLTVFVGASNSGRSNLLAAIDLFFRELDPLVERKIGQINEYVWFNKDTSVPVTFTIALEASQSELSHHLIPEILKEINLLSTNILEIKRTITGPPASATWHNEDVKINDTFLIKAGKAAFMPEVTGELGKSILHQISHQLNDRFQLIRASRLRPEETRGVTDRETALQSRILDEIAKLGAHAAAPKSSETENTEAKVRKLCRDLSDLRLTGGFVPRQTRGLKEEGEAFPMEGDNEEVVELYCQIFGAEENKVLGIEDPEMHLDTSRTTQLIRVLEEMSHHKQVFVATHSSIFIDESGLRSVWVFRREKNETRVYRVKESKELRSLLHELRLRPSDIFLANGLIFVETHVEKEVLPIWAAKMGIDFDKLGISLVPIYGRTTGNYHFPAWAKAAEEANVPYHFILNKSALAQAEAFDGRLLSQKKLFLLDKSSIEEYYPGDRIMEALEKEYGVLFPEKEEALQSPREINIEKLIVTKGKDPVGWNIVVGGIIAEAMSADEIPEEIKHALLDIGVDYERSQ